MAFQTKKGFEVQPEFEQVDDSTIIGTLRWETDDGHRRERFQVVTVRDVKISDLQGCASRREAERFIRSR